VSVRLADILAFRFIERRLAQMRRRFNSRMYRRFPFPSACRPLDPPAARSAGRSIRRPLDPPLLAAAALSCQRHESLNKYLKHSVAIL